eukprot:TRINITY_DN1540_c0_g2_i1.p1 TRINITY_DN1540_c0_g2~~TRINITY_DN1540_c0_g2_i1.p1  ORF type:complete len:114 (+),score=28.84 TRINITY_DN1540_c0_g2_i1:167-508(+)
MSVRRTIGFAFEKKTQMSSMYFLYLPDHPLIQAYYDNPKGTLSTSLTMQSNIWAISDHTSLDGKTPDPERKNSKKRGGLLSLADAKAILDESKEESISAKKSQAPEAPAKDQA